VKFSSHNGIVRLARPQLLGNKKEAFETPCSWLLVNIRLQGMNSWLRKHTSASAVTTFIGAVVGILGGVLELPTVVIVLGGLIAAGGALWSAIEREQFEHELRQRSDEIADLNRKIAASVTGGDSFCFLTLGTWEDVPDRALLMIIHQGEHPLYDVTATIVDVQKFQREVAAGQVALNRPSTTSFPVGNMSPTSSQVLGEHWPLPGADEQAYNVFFNARNGSSHKRFGCGE
jgi:hypothetical protein